MTAPATPPATPAVAGVVSAAEVRATADAIARVQLASGGIPWFEGGRLDPWDHVQSAMGLLAAGRREEAEAAYDWSRTTQREDGSWAMEYHGGVVTDPHTDSNFCAYLATGVWHHWLTTRDLAVVERLWPAVAAGVEAALALQRDDGAVAWATSPAGPVDDALLTGNASIQLSLRCAAALGALVGDPQPAWRQAAGRIRHAVRRHPEAFLPKATHAMDWYYPVLTGAVRGVEASAWLDERWDEFVVADLGARCVADHPWVTGGETAELALALAAVGRRDDAVALLAAMQHLRHDDGSYWTGLVYADGLRWPVEQTTWTGATVVLAADALSRATPAHGLFRGDHLPPAEEEVSDACPCLLAS